MARTLTAIPAVAFPAGSSLRPYRAGDEVRWLAIHTAADKYTDVTLDLFDLEFGAAHAELARRQLYAADEAGQAIGTVTAWLPERDIDPAFGRVHWLAVLPTHQRRGIGSALLASALSLLATLGYTSAYLVSLPVRRDALRIYQRFGFEVVRRHDLRAR